VTECKKEKAEQDEPIIAMKKAAKAFVNLFVSAYFVLTVFKAMIDTQKEEKKDDQ
jgi:hypothetical protein